MASKIVEDVIRMFRGGVGIAEIGSALELPTSTVVALLLRGGVEDPELESLDEQRRIGDLGSVRTGVVSDAVKKLVVAAWMKWTPMAQICARYSMRKSMVWQILLEEGVPVRRRVAMRELVRLRRDAEIVDLYLEGMHLFDISAAVGVGHRKVNDILRKYNVPRRLVKKGPIRRSRDGFGKMKHPRDILRELE